MSDIKVCRCLDLNGVPLASETTALPTEPHHCPKIRYYCGDCGRHVASRSGPFRQFSIANVSKRSMKRLFDGLSSFTGNFQGSI